MRDRGAGASSIIVIAVRRNGRAREKIAVAALRNYFPLFVEIAIDATTIYVLLIVFAATLIRSAFGFGEALFAVPLLAMRIPLREATPLAVLISITIAAMVVVQDWKKIHFRSTGWLLLPTLAGIPLGLWLLTSSHQQALKGALAVFLMAFAAYSLSGRNVLVLHDDHRAWLLGCGFAAGVLGGAWGMNGPPLVIYGSMRRWSAKHFRATLQAYFLPAGLLGMTGYWLSGLWVSAVTHYFLYSLPVIIPAVLLGREVNHRLSGEAFLRYAYAGLGVIGAVLMVQAVTGRP